MAAFNKFNITSENIMEGVHNLGSHTLKVMLTNVAPAATNSVKADLTEIAAGNGYTAGGATVVVTASAHTAGAYKLTVDDIVWTAAGGSMATFRYAVLYNDTPTSPADPLLGWHDYGAAITLLVGETFTWDADQAAGLLTAAFA